MHRSQLKLHFCNPLKMPNSEGINKTFNSGWIQIIVNDNMYLSTNSTAGLYNKGSLQSIVGVSQQVTGHGWLSGKVVTGICWKNVQIHGRWNEVPVKKKQVQGSANFGLWEFWHFFRWIKKFLLTKFICRGLVGALSTKCETIWNFCILAQQWPLFGWWIFIWRCIIWLGVMAAVYGPKMMGGWKRVDLEEEGRIVGLSTYKPQSTVPL